jgi:hypothetical protein
VRFDNFSKVVKSVQTFFAVGGFTEEAIQFGQAHGIGMTEQIEYL